MLEGLFDVYSNVGTPELLVASESESRHPGCAIIWLKTLKIVIFFQRS